MGTALISNIQRFSLDDGPGIRTTVFFKGCNLRCSWCHNPETLDLSPVLQFIDSYCDSCGKCTDSCPQQAHSIKYGIHAFERDKCIGCGLCVPVCPKDALKIIGKQYTPSDLFTEIIKDKHYYLSSQGGVTFSGGEPALAVDFIIVLAKMCQVEGITMTLDTAGNVPFTFYKKLLPYISLFLYDLKCFDSEQHKRWTKVDNHRILKNLQALDKENAVYTIRVPIIPSFNTNLKEQQNIAQFIASLTNPGLIQLLPYHDYGVGKYETLGLNNETKSSSPPSNEFLEEALQCYLQLGLNAEVA
jgi:pyruvate formate lyase activating enzyme